jgi:hypothetical protein
MIKFLSIYDRVFNAKSDRIGSKCYSPIDIATCDVSFEETLEGFTMLVIATAEELFWLRMAAFSTRKNGDDASSHAARPLIDIRKL